MPEQQTPQPALKICGLTETDQALAIAAMGVDAIGVIGVAETPRFVEATARRHLFEALAREAAQKVRQECGFHHTKRRPDWSPGDPFHGQISFQI